MVDMAEVWRTQTIQVGEWTTIYAGLCQGAMTAACMATKEEEDPIDYEALASEADEAYSRLAARLTNSR